MNEILPERVVSHFFLYFSHCKNIMNTTQHNIALGINENTEHHDYTFNIIDGVGHVVRTRDGALCRIWYPGLKGWKEAWDRCRGDNARECGVVSILDRIMDSGRG